MDAKYFTGAVILSKFSILISVAAYGQVVPPPIPPNNRIPEVSPPTFLEDRQAPLTPPVIAPVETDLEEGYDGKIKILSYDIEGSTVFSKEALDNKTREFTGGNKTFTDIQKARDAIEKLYSDLQYKTTGAYIPTGQTLLIDGAVVKIRVLEGKLEDIKVSGTGKLDPNYIKSRLALVTQQPLNNNRLLEGLRLLQQSPLFESISAEISAGSKPGTNILEIKVKERKPFTAEIGTNNNRPPSVGSWQRRVQLNYANPYGVGDSLTAAVGNSEGNTTIDGSYTIPLSPYNTTLTLNAGGSQSAIIEEPYKSLLNLRSASRYYEVSLRQPLLAKASTDTTQEFALALSASKADSQLSGDAPFPISLLAPGSNEQGTTSVSAIRFSQEYTQRNRRSVVSLKSQLNFGLGAFDSTIRENGTDSRFFSWQGQGRWVQRVADNTDIVFQGKVQLADRPLLPLEQLSLGGQNTIRGYRQDAIISDNGVFASAEMQLPIAGTGDNVLQVAPFVDFGSVWNQNASNLVSNTTVLSTGLGLQWRTNDFTARLDYGIPLINNISSRKTSWQENGFYFSIRYFPF
jgi:hemolysin activation/secretion protein